MPENRPTYFGRQFHDPSKGKTKFKQFGEAYQLYERGQEPVIIPEDQTLKALSEIKEAILRIEQKVHNNKESYYLSNGIWRK